MQPQWCANDFCIDILPTFALANLQFWQFANVFCQCNILEICQKFYATNVFHYAVVKICSARNL